MPFCSLSLIRYYQAISVYQVSCNYKRYNLCLEGTCRRIKQCAEDLELKYVWVGALGQPEETKLN